MFRHLYITDWGDDAKLLRCHMDGFSCTVLLRGLQNPNSLAVDGSMVHVVDSQLKHRSTPSHAYTSTLITMSTTSNNWTAKTLSQINVFNISAQMKYYCLN